MTTAHAGATPSESPRPVQARITASGSVAGILRDLASVEGRSPEALAAEWAAGELVIPDVSAGDAIDDWGLFDGPPDLAGRVHDHLRDGHTA